MTDIRKTTEPHDRLTRLCEAMTTALDNHPERHDGDHCVVLLMDDERGGIVIHGYDDPDEAVIDLFLHLRVMFKAQGKDLSIVPLTVKGQG